MKHVNEVLYEINFANGTLPGVHLSLNRHYDVFSQFIKKIHKFIFLIVTIALCSLSTTQISTEQTKIVFVQNAQSSEKVQTQRGILSLTEKIAKKDGHKNPDVLKSIILQETLAGSLKTYRVAGNKGDEYYGLAQIKLGAAKDVLKKHPTLWRDFKFQTRTDDEIKANLILNDEFNIAVSSKYLKFLEDNYKLKGRELVNAYNRGAAGVKKIDSRTFHYAIQAERKLAHWKQNGRV